MDLSSQGPLMPRQTLTEAPADCSAGPCCCQQSLSDAPTFSSACEITMILCKIIIITMQEPGFPEHEPCSKHTQQPQVSRVGFPGSLPPVLLPASRYNTPGPGVTAGDRQLPRKSCSFWGSTDTQSPAQEPPAALSPHQQQPGVSTGRKFLLPKRRLKAEGQERCGSGRAPLLRKP